MNCMKCGREISENQVFCSKCLELMAQHPVKSDVVVQLPHRKEVFPKKVQPRRKTLSPEEQILQLKKKYRQLAVVTVFLLVASLVLTCLTLDFIGKLDVQKLRGQNYSTVETID